MKILMVSGEFPPMKKGVGDYAFHVAQFLAKQELAVQVVTTENESSSDNFFDSTLDIHRIISTWTITEVFKIIKLINKSDEKTIVNIQYHCPSVYGRRLMINFLPVILRIFRSKCRVVVTMHGFWEQSLLFKLRTIPMLRACHGVIFVDRLNTNLIKKYSGKSPNKLKFIQIASNIIPIKSSLEKRSEWRKNLGYGQENIVISYFGAIGPPKGFEYLIAALAELRNQKKLPLNLLAIGGFHSYRNDEYTENIKKIIEDPDIRPWVKIIQEPDPEDCSKLLHCSDFAIFPFINGVAQNSGSTLAALAHQLPTIVTEGPGGSRQFYENLGVYVVPPKNTKALAQCLSSILNSQEEHVYKQKKAADCDSQLSWNNIADETVDFFHSLFAT